jgi:hypothetical protein
MLIILMMMFGKVLIKNVPSGEENGLNMQD